jgi:peptidoglycan hydrolase-like protein with peptidoglycan-binding domain
MNTDKLLGLIFLGFMAGSVVISTSTDKDSPEVEEQVSEVQLVVNDRTFDNLTEDWDTVLPETESTDVEEPDVIVVEEPVEEVVVAKAEPVEQVLSGEELRTLAVLTSDYRWKEVSNMVVNLQVIINVTPDGVYGHMTRNAHIRALKDRGLDDTIVPSVPTYAITPRCEQWWDTALSVGWEESELLQLGAIMYAESRCTPDAISQTSDYGLAQINWTAHGERLSAKGITRQDLLDPVINLREARAIADFGLLAFGCQWQPWYMSGSWC